MIKKFFYRLRGEYPTEKLVKNGMKLGENFKRMNDVIIDPSHCFLITIGNNVTLAPRVHILAHDASTKLFLGYTKIGKVTIGNNVFIGANTTILPNCIIGDNVIVGAGSVVTSNLLPDSVYVGNPARRLCDIDDYINKNKINMQISPVYSKDYRINYNLDEVMKDKMLEELENKIGYIE